MESCIHPALYQKYRPQPLCDASVVELFLLKLYLLSFRNLVSVVQQLYQRVIRLLRTTL